MESVSASTHVRVGQGKAASAGQPAATVFITRVQDIPQFLDAERSRAAKNTGRGSGSRSHCICCSGAADSVARVGDHKDQDNHQGAQFLEHGIFSL